VSLELRELKGDKEAASERAAAEERAAINAIEAERAEHNRKQDLVGALRVACRVRPLSSAEQAKKATSVVSVEHGGRIEQRVSVKHQSAGSGNAETRHFDFTHVYGPEASQEEIFADAAPLMTSVLDGFNVCIFAYGQSGTGKTHTMEGHDAAPGLAPRAMRRVFEVMHGRQASGGFNHEVFVSQLEIHNEAIRDLLADPKDAANTKYDIQRDASLGCYVRNLVSSPVDNADAALRRIKQGNSNRAVGVTNLNEQSSRSHMIVALIVLTTNTRTGARRVGKLSLVDLAGSERLSKAQTTGTALKETQAINKSLSALGSVLNALATKSAHVPYRDSKLTYLLQDSLGGNSKTLMLVACGPAKDNSQETVNSLTFASRAKAITLGKAEVREMPASGSPRGGKAASTSGARPGSARPPSRAAPARRAPTQ